MAQKATVIYRDILLQWPNIGSKSQATIESVFITVSGAADNID